MERNFSASLYFFSEIDSGATHRSKLFNVPLNTGLR